MNLASQRTIYISTLVAVAAAGGSLIVLQSQNRPPAPSPLRPALGISDPEAARKLHLREQKDHPVTLEMTTTARSLDATSAPAFALSDPDGNIYRMEELSRTKPLVIFFIEKECPCCLGAKYFIDKMMDLYKDHVNVVGIINADGAVAKEWRRATRPKFLVLQDPRQTAIRAYKAERGVYTTLVAPGGTINKAYAGYSISMLRDLGQRIAKLANVPEQEYHSIAAPKTLTSGCVFPEPEQKQS